jgi:ABC-type lipoprotein release transport system permease subunit
MDLIKVSAGRVIESLLFGVQPGEPWILMAAALVLAALGLLSSWVPALRAARTEPARLLSG